MTVNHSLLRTVVLASLLLPQAASSKTQTALKSFVPEVVFVGHSEGKGDLRLVLGRRRTFTVKSLGTIQGDGRLRLQQTVRFEGKEPHTRTFVLWQTSPGHYSATLTEAAGPVIGSTEGNRLRLHYRMNRWGLRMQQTLELADDERTVLNTGRIRFLGIPIGTLRETILLMN